VRQLTGIGVSTLTKGTNRKKSAKMAKTIKATLRDNPISSPQRIS
jgi:hypothetical protein